MNESQVTLVLTDSVEEGPANVTGVIKNSNVTIAGYNLSVVVATDYARASYRQVNVTELISDPEAHSFRAIRTTGSHTRVSARANTDGESAVSMYQAVGLLSATPSEQVVISDPGSRARTAVLDASNGSFNGTAIADSASEYRDRTLVTVGSDRAFYAHGSTQLNGTVIPAGTTARSFLASIDADADVQNDTSVVYTFSQTLDGQTVDAVSTVNNNRSEYIGEMVTLEADIVGGHASTEELLENSSQQCSPDNAYIPTPTGGVCAPLQYDVVVHIGVAVDDSPNSSSDVLPVVGLSNSKLEELYATETGRYQVTGRIVALSQLNDSLPDRPVLVIASRERLESLDKQELATDTASATLDRLQLFTAQAAGSESNTTTATGPTSVDTGFAPPTDPDDDALYEDLNGDGRLSIADIQAIFKHYSTTSVQSQMDRFDFNGDGQISILDVQALYAALTD